MNVAGSAVEAVTALPVRGWPLVVLLSVRVVVVAAGVGAAVALWHRRPAAIVLARMAVVLSAAAQLLVYGTSIAPNNRAPGDTPLYVAATLAVHGGWLVYLVRARRVREMLT